jgi:peptide/nickel transport system ATP-binding protein
MTGTPVPAPATPPTAAAGADGPLLHVSDLAVEFARRDLPPVRVVDGVSFEIAPREIVGLVGESGSGKTVTMLSLLRLVPPPGRIADGRILFDGRDIRALDPEAMRLLRGDGISLIPPDATAALNPVVRAGDQVAEGIASHRPGVSAADARARVLEMFRRVGLPNPELRYGRYPHELSGGMQQRALIASALLMGPRLILADEPTTALDVTIQAQILRLLLEVREAFGTAILYVTHDLATVAEICDRVLVMYAGHLVESAPVRTLFAAPLHPYTRALLGSIPPLSAERVERLAALPGTPPDPASWPAGCRFAPRCPLRAKLGGPAICEEADPAFDEVASDHRVACHFPGAEAEVLARLGRTGAVPLTLSDDAPEMLVDEIPDPLAFADEEESRILDDDHGGHAA